jgi:tetratricopeptide (TPR) repeat protein
MIRGYSYCFVGDAVAGNSDLNEAVRLAPEQGAIYLTRGLAYLCIGEWATALPDFQHTPPDLRGGTWLLGRTMAIFQLGRYEQAICEAKDFLAADNEDVHASAALAWFLATCPVASLRDGEQSVRLAQKAKNGESLDWWMIHACLAVARAETGSFKDAIRHGHVALQTAPAGWRGKCEAALACFTTDRPYRDESINPTSAGEGVQSH